MKQFILNNKKVLLLVFIVVFITLFINIFKFKKINNDSNIYEFSTLKEGDIIPFNSRIVGNFNLHIKFESSDKKTIHYITSRFIKANHTNVYYCKSSKCLDNQKYNTVRNLYNVGNSTFYDYNVSNYKDIFGRNTNYTGWEVHFIPFEYINEDYHTMYIGTYYDIVLVPTSNKTNNCLNNIDKYGISNNYEIIDKSDSFNINNNNFYLKNNTKGYIDIKFNSKKGDQILFDLNTTSDTLKLYLNDKDITDVLGLWNNDNYYRYNTKIIDILEDGTYTLRLEENIVNDSDNNVFDRIVNIKNFTIFSPSSKMSADTFYTSCNEDIIIGKVK